MRDLVRERPESIASLASAYYRLEKREEARSVLAQLDPTRADPRQIFSCAQLAADGDDFETAERLLVAIESRHPDPAGVGHDIAAVRYRAGRRSESRDKLLELIAAGHQTAAVYSLLGLCNRELGLGKEAQAAFLRALELEPTQESGYLDLARSLAVENQWRSVLEICAK